ncbi:protein RDM16 isoform X2 [Silene latifolia]
MPVPNKGTGAISHVSSQVGAIGDKETGNLTATGFASRPSSSSSASAALKPVGSMDPEKYEAVKRAQELAVKMGFRQDPEFAPLINLFPGQLPPDFSVVQKPAKAPVLRLDALGREIDEHGNVVNISKPSNLSTLKVNINKQKKDAFQIEKPELEVDPDKNPHFDPRMGIDKNKLLRPKRQNFQFVEEGKWSKDAEIIKLRSQFGEAQAKELKAKQAQLAKAKAEPNINPNLIEVAERVTTKEKKSKEPIPEVEWWDVSLLRSANYADLDDGGPVEDKLKMEKITIYVEHPKPIEPPLEAPPPPPQPLKLTKKEQKKLRTQRRLAAEKDKQEMIRQGLMEPPKAKIKMSNLNRVLGAEATQDPTRMEKEVRAAAAEREQAHIDRNIARKLTPAERREKKERKLFDDPNTLETIVSVYKINDLSNPQNRFKVDINAQENRLTGCAVLHEGFSVVAVEGGMKSIKRYAKLMLRRIDWAAKLDKEDEEEDNEEEKVANRCVLVWQGSVARPSFSRFYVHDCTTEASARKVFNDAGVGHYWDLAANFVEDQV